MTIKDRFNQWRRNRAMIAAANALRRSEAHNYISAELRAGTQTVEVLVRWVEGKTPAQMAGEWKTRAQAAEAKLASHPRPPEFRFFDNDVQFRDRDGHRCEVLRREYIANEGPGAVRVLIGGTNAHMMLPPGSRIDNQEQAS